MAICKECDAEITSLKVNWSETVWYQDCYDIDGWEGEVDQVDSEGEGNYEFMCPECDEVLFYDEDEAHDFLREKEEVERQNPNSDIRIDNV